MWNFNSDTGKWYQTSDVLSKTSYDSLKQDIQSTRLYSKALSGASYVPINNLNNIYDVLDNNKGTASWAIGSTYSINSVPSNYTPIDYSTLDEYYNKYAFEYGLTLKGLFTPSRLINDSFNNYVYVDVATTIVLNNIGSVSLGLVIDGVSLKEGHRILVKNQIQYVNLDISEDPDYYFTYVNPAASYTVVKNNITSIQYSYYGSDNGIYVYTNNQLVREPDLATYSDAYRYSVSVKLGIINTGKQFHLSRLLTGYYPLNVNGNNIEFLEKHNWILRNQVDYNNIYDITYNDIIEHGDQQFQTNGITYSIPARIITVGEFGLIINNQDEVSNIINSKYKVNLSSISQNNKFYWICGSEGVLLKISKIDFSISEIDLQNINDYNSICFFGDLIGLVVGEFNTIYYTSDGGNNWIDISHIEFDAYSYNKVIIYSPNQAFIGGDNGVFIQLTLSGGVWTFYKRNVSRFDIYGEEYLLVDDINDIRFASFTASNPWNLTYSGTDSNTILSDKEIVLIAANNNNVVLYDINNFISEYDYIFLEWSIKYGDIKNIFQISGSSSIYFSSDNLYKFNINDFGYIGTFSNNLIISTTSSIIYDGYINYGVDYNGEELLLCGNNSLLLKNDYISDNFINIDSDFNNRYDSKFLFLDYDIASKLNFYDSLENYRLPNSITFSTISSSIEITNNTRLIGSNTISDYNWLNFYRDSEKTFQYYTSIDTSTQVEFSTTFTICATNSFQFTGYNITNDYSDISNLAPNIGNPSASRFISTATPITTSTASQTVFMYKYLSIFKIPVSQGFSVEIGDVLYLQSDVINDTIIVNRIEILFDNQYIYCYIDFNQTIINQLKGLSTIITLLNLNKFIDPSDIPNNFELHPISFGYGITYNGSAFSISPRFNNLTAYYNMESNIIVDGTTYSMSYDNTFLTFGYKPNYNIYDYLFNIDNGIFNVSKKFLSMPQYQSLPGNNTNSFTSSNIYIDTNIDTNQLLFGSNFQLEWESIWINTFVDVTLHTNLGNYLSERYLVMNKYYDSSQGGYVILFHKRLIYDYFVNVSSIDIISRSNIQQVSDDLQVINNIQKSYTNKSIQSGYQFTNLSNELNFKISTDSYAKILLSDGDVKKSLSSIIYTDVNHNLSMNAINLGKEIDINISSTTHYQDIDYITYLAIATSTPHNLETHDGVTVIFTGGTGSSEQLNSSYFGYQVVKGIIDEYTFFTDKLYGNDIPSLDPGIVTFIQNDPFFNYQPVDIFDVGIDKNVKISVEILPENIELISSQYSLVNLDLTKFKYQLVDGLGISDIDNLYPWILDAEISNAIIGQDANGLVWYSGTWRYGRWFGGTWHSGDWINGDWYGGIWNSFKTTFKLLNVVVNSSAPDNRQSNWYGGRWFGGSWNGGSWYNGRWYGGSWNTGTWYNGIWNDGTWNDGEFQGGIWIQGIWNDGDFNSNNKPSYWLNGNWNGGDFENGVWYNGNFAQLGSSVSRFGTGAFNTRQAIWEAGKFKGGEFHSYLNLDSNGNPIASIKNQYSIWKTGIWSGGSWYGGVAYAIDFNSGIWYSGVIEEIDVIGILTQIGLNTQLKLYGNFIFNIGDTIWIVNDNTPTSYDSVGSNQYPGKYRILEINIDTTNNDTTIMIDRDLSGSIGVVDIGFSNPTVDIGLRLTTIFKNSIWKSGIWTNGIFDSGYFEGGLWLGGLFNSSSNWGR